MNILNNIVLLLLDIYVLSVISILLVSFIILRIKKRKKLIFIEKKVINSNKQSSTNSNNIKNLILSFTNALLWYGSIIVGKFPFHFIRRFLYSSIYRVSIKKGSSIYHGCEIINPWNVSISEGSIIGIENKIDGRGNVFIGKNVNMSHQVNIWTMQHDPNDSLFATVIGSVEIGDYVWIGNRVTILPGIKISEGAVIASGSVVTKDIEPYSIYGGVPAKKIGTRNSGLKYSIGIMPII